MNAPRTTAAWVLTLALTGCTTAGGDDDATDSPTDSESPADTESDTPDDPCADVTCDHGTCEVDGDMGSCDCDDGWEGDACDELTGPPQAGLELWLDANDPANTGAAPTGDVGVWVDKTGNTVNFVAPADKPAAVDGPNGLKVLEFDGFGDYMTSADFDGLTGIGHYTIIIVGYSDGNDQTFLAGTKTGTNDHGLLIKSGADGTGRKASFTHRMPFGNSGGDQVATSSELLDNAGLNWIWAVRTPEGGDVFKLSLYAGQVNGDVEPLGSADDFDANLDLAIGRLGAGASTEYLGGQIGEILVYVGSKRPNMNPEIVTYLEERWGL